MDSPKTIFFSSHQTAPPGPMRNVLYSRIVSIFDDFSRSYLTCKTTLRHWIDSRVDQKVYDKMKLPRQCICVIIIIFRQFLIIVCDKIWKKTPWCWLHRGVLTLRCWIHRGVSTWRRCWMQGGVSILQCWIQRCVNRNKT